MMTCRNGDINTVPLQTAQNLQDLPYSPSLWCSQHSSSVTYFIIAGIPGLHDWKARIVLFVVFLAIYTITILENFIFIFVIKFDNGLHSPMYMFICNLAFLDLLIPSVTIPEMLYYLITEDGSIAFGPCITQMAFYLTFLITESFTLVVMAYDRYQAICNPLLYPTVMTTKHAFLLSTLCWTIGSTDAMLRVYFVLSTFFCGANRIEYFLCDYASIMLLASTDVTIKIQYNMFMSVMIISVQLFLVLFSYGKIIMAVFRINSDEGQRKAFSTCGSHLLVIGVFYIALAFVLVSYSLPGISEQIRQALAGTRTAELPSPDVRSSVASDYDSEQAQPGVAWHSAFGGACPDMGADTFTDVGFVPESLESKANIARNCQS
ncbi:olfactory receptor 2D2-like [Protopterus annectens]|uniref:olfactory receptor 2D2-like n=1 Tax=Protopterus annectens TaxID=7888 RepID=UPI001CFB051E|nr:olfactory receptor 2D2-like [Protopterus annectens]